MDRTRPDSKDIIPVFLAKAGALGERAARAMCPNGSTYPLASLQKRNVITLQTELAGAQEPVHASATQQGQGRNVSVCRIGNGEAESRGAANER